MPHLAGPTSKEEEDLIQPGEASMEGEFRASMVGVVLEASRSNRVKREVLEAEEKAVDMKPQEDTWVDKFRKIVQPTF